MGMIFDVQHFSVHDGPGIRTILFCKGCPLRCEWCCNPESRNASCDIGFAIDHCIRCGNCVKVCPCNAITDTGTAKAFDIGKCRECVDKLCAYSCPSQAIEIFGREITAEEAFKELKEDTVFYQESGGGVTMSGGESMAQADFLGEVLLLCKAEGMNTAIETGCCCEWSDFEKVIAYTDLFLCDLKHVNREKFNKHVGKGFDLIIENLKKLAAENCNMIIRVPVIPGFNSEEGEIRDICRFTNEIGVKEIHLLPYHRLGKSKYDKLFMDFPMKDVEPPGSDIMKRLCGIAEEAGLTVANGG
jgi:pyruvate formate lyase activating enzyme